jgi:hypothetical protein
MNTNPAPPKKRIYVGPGGNLSVGLVNCIASIERDINKWIVPMSLVAR